MSHTVYNSKRQQRMSHTVNSISAKEATEDEPYSVYSKRQQRMSHTVYSISAKEATEDEPYSV